MFSFGEKRIPTIFAIGVLLILLTGLTFATRGVGQLKKLFSFAQEETAPSSAVKIANISESSFAVFWTTDKETNGAIFYGTTPSLEIGVAVDERDLASPNGKYKTHFVRLSNLKEKTKYYFKIGSTEPSFGDPAKNQAPYEVTTAPQLPSAPTIDPIYGQVRTSSAAPANGAIALWQAPDISPLAALTKSDGNYVLPLAMARTQDLSSYPTFSNNLSETVTIDAGAGMIASISCTYGSDRPLPAVQLGQSVNCGSGSSSPGVNSEPSATPASSASVQARFKPHGGYSSPVPTSGSLQVNIASGQAVSTAFPTFSGKSGPNQLVKIVVHSDTSYSGTVIAGPDGSWSWTPPAGLSPGQHTVTITVVNPDGSTQTVNRTFFVNTSGPILPVTSGTPSAQTTPTPAVTASPTPQFSLSATPTPQPPTTGSSDQTIIILALGAIFSLLSGAVVVYQISKPLTIN